MYLGVTLAATIPADPTGSRAREFGRSCSASRQEKAKRPYPSSHPTLCSSDLSNARSSPSRMLYLAVRDRSKSERSMKPFEIQ